MKILKTKVIPRTIHVDLTFNCNIQLRTNAEMVIFSLGIINETVFVWNVFPKNASITVYQGKSETNDVQLLVAREAAAGRGEKFRVFVGTLYSKNVHQKKFSEQIFFPSRIFKDWR